MSKRERQTSLFIWWRILYYTFKQYYGNFYCCLLVILYHYFLTLLLKFLFILRFLSNSSVRFFILLVANLNAQTWVCVLRISLLSFDLSSSKEKGCNNCGGSFCNVGLGCLLLYWTQVFWVRELRPVQLQLTLVWLVHKLCLVCQEPRSYAHGKRSYFG